MVVAASKPPYRASGREAASDDQRYCARSGGFHRHGFPRDEHAGQRGARHPLERPRDHQSTRLPVARYRYIAGIISLDEHRARHSYDRKFDLRVVDASHTGDSASRRDIRCCWACQSSRPLSRRNSSVSCSSGVSTALFLQGEIGERAVYDMIKASGVPLVVTWKLFLEDAELPTVSFDNYRGGLVAMEHLIALGHRKIGLICGRTELNDRARERRRAYEDIDNCLRP